VASLLKRWLLGTHQGAIAPEHLDYYLDEFTFRFNRRTSASRGKLFYRLAQQAVQVSPVPYQILVGGSNNPKTPPVVVGGVNRIALLVRFTLIWFELGLIAAEGGAGNFTAETRTPPRRRSLRLRNAFIGS